MYVYMELIVGVRDALEMSWGPVVSGVTRASCCPNTAGMKINTPVCVIRRLREIEYYRKHLDAANRLRYVFLLGPNVQVAHASIGMQYSAHARASLPIGVHTQMTTYMCIL